MLSILSALGIDSTLFVQLGIYLVAYVILYTIAFKPYFLASEERRKQTSGSLDSAAKVAEQIAHAEEKYQTRARQINDEVSFLFKEQRALATKEIDGIYKSAQEKTKAISNQAQQQISLQLEKASTALAQSSDEVAKVIVEQILNSRGGAR